MALLPFYHALLRMLEIWALLLLPLFRIHGSEYLSVRLLPALLEKEVSGGYSYTLNCEYNISSHDFTSGYNPNFILRYNKNPCSIDSNNRIVYTSQLQSDPRIDGQDVQVYPTTIPHNDGDTDFPLAVNITISANSQRPDPSSISCGHALFFCDVLVENGQGTIKVRKAANISFIVRAKIENVSADVQVQEDQQIQLFCEGSGRPTPIITWHRANEQSFPDHGGRTKYVSSDSKGLLTIPKAAAHHDGDYICTVNNKFDSPDSATVKVTVNYKPVVSAEAVVIYQKTDYHAELKCSAKANTGITAHGWEKHDNEHIEVLNITAPSSAYYELENAMAKASGDNRSYRVLSQDLTSTLVIKSVQLADFKGKFCCVFTNSFGSRSKCIEVAESNVPVAVDGKPAEYSPLSGVAEYLPSCLLILSSLSLTITAAL